MGPEIPGKGPLLTPLAVWFERPLHSMAQTSRPA